jgi:hypothetical protein
MMRILSETLFTIVSVLLIFLPFIEEAANITLYKFIGWASVSMFTFVILLELISLALIKKKELSEGKGKDKKLSIKSKK